MSDKPEGVQLIPYRTFLAPKHATHKKIHILVPSALPYSGKVTIAITKEAFWVVAPSGDYEQVPFKNIKDVKLDSFPGIVYKEEIDGVETYVAPNDTAALTVEYSKLGRVTHRISFLTFLPHHAHDWIRLITAGIDAMYIQTLSEPIEKTGDEDK